MYYEAIMESQLLTAQELDQHVKNGTFRLAFVGMSNAGKSYRSEVLRDELGFIWFQVDADIQKNLGFQTMAEISSWLGYPTSEGYGEREAEYLRLENLATRHASMKTEGKNLVFDTTGSVAHMEEETLTVLKDNCLVVHLDVGEDSLEEVIERFFLKPKPVAWCGYLTREDGETDEQALRRCYPALLRDRLATYRSLAHVTVPAKEVRDTSADETLGVIKKYLEKV